MSIDDIKVGDYIRTEYGIAKIKSFETKSKEVINLDKDIMLCNMDCYRNCCTINQVIKSRPNIIDLIEEKDIITYEYETSIGKIIEYNVTVLLSLLNELEENPNKYKIKSIITHEQIETMEYKIER